jgi:hypothetical protein
MTNTATTIASVVDSYLAAWNEPDADRRRALVSDTWTDDGTYLDPLMSGAGIEQITAMIGAAQAQFPGHRFALSEGPDAHNDVVRFSWSLASDGAPVARGQDFAVVAPDGRFHAVTGFLELTG